MNQKTVKIIRKFSRLTNHQIAALYQEWYRLSNNERFETRKFMREKLSE